MILRKSRQLSPLQQAILEAVTYADIFDFPLTLTELHRYCKLETSPQIIYEEIHRSGLLNQAGSFYTLFGRESLILKRLRRGEVSARLWPRAIRYGKLIARLPFVRMVAVTGSLAVNNTDDPADVDYLVVTEAGRLWTARAMILGLGRIAAQQGLVLCPNYMITTRNLEFDDHNLYVAHEVAQMVPISGLEVYGELRRQNSWVAEYLPNADGPPVESEGYRSDPRSWLRPVLEAFLRLPPGDWLERWEMDRKVKMLTDEQGSGLESLFSGDVCKGHDQGHKLRTKKLLDLKASGYLADSLE